jgi:AcrR family transcriptional regulator
MQLEFTLSVDAPGTLRPGGRTARTRAAVMAAVIEELSEHGYAGARLERVAARAGVAKTTIYRRWGNLDGLLADLMAERAAQEIPVPDEGDLGSDLRVLARQAVASVRDPAVRAALASIVAAAVQSPAAREVLTRFLAGRAATMTVIVDRAMERGEVPAGTDGADIIRTVTALIYYRLFIAGEPAGEEVADSAAAIAAAAARAGAAGHGTARPGQTREASAPA